MEIINALREVCGTTAILAMILVIGPVYYEAHRHQKGGRRKCPTRK